MNRLSHVPTVPLTRNDRRERSLFVQGGERSPFTSLQQCTGRVPRNEILRLLRLSVAGTFSSDVRVLCRH